MRKANTVLGIIQDRGKRGLPLTDLYRQLFNPDLFLLAYGRIYANTGSMTPGVTPETVDGMSLDKINKLIDQLRHERYQWTPARRVYIEKKGSTKKRPLGIPGWSDKLLQEVMRLLLEAFYEPQFSPFSHGFRPKRGCHTALQEVYHKWVGTKWFVEGDIAQCFDSLDHPTLVSILREKIKDNRFVRLLEGLLQAGYLEEWRYHSTHSGSPQGAILSPILANIYLSKLDEYVQSTLLPQYTRGIRREPNQPWQQLQHKASRLKAAGKFSEAKHVRRQMRNVPSLNPTDPDYRRIRYIRYADDWLIGFSGPRQEAEMIKQQIGTFLQEQLKLRLSESKTLITHARTEAARFLGYDLVILNNNHKLDQRGHRSVNGQVGLRVPSTLVKQKCMRYLKGGKPIHRAELVHDSAYSIVVRYQQEFRGLAGYYRLAYNLHSLNQLKWVMERSLVQTLAHKLRISVKRVYQRYQVTLQTDQGPRVGLQVKVERANQRPLLANWGGVSLARSRKAVLEDTIQYRNGPRSELEQRLLATTCELCGSSEDVEVHHVRALKDLNKPGRAELPHWKQVMISRKRKTLVVCRQCHLAIHAGRPTRQRSPGLTTLESRVL